MLDQKISIEVRGVEYSIEFGYGAFYILSEMWEAKNFTELGKKFIQLNFAEGVEPTFKQYNILGDIVLAGIKNVPDHIDVEIRTADIVGVLIKDISKLTVIMQVFMRSLPTAEAGKKQVKKKQVAQKQKV